MTMVILFFLLCYISYQDIAKKKISNISVCFLAIISVLVLNFDETGKFSKGLGDSFISCVVFLLLFLFIYSCGWMGAGDVKLGSVLAFLVGLQNFLVVWCFSAILAFLYPVGLDLLFRVNYFLGLRNYIVLNNSMKKRFVPYGACLCIPIILISLKEV